MYDSRLKNPFSVEYRYDFGTNTVTRVSEPVKDMIIDIKLRSDS